MNRVVAWFLSGCLYEQRIIFFLFCAKFDSGAFEFGCVQCADISARRLRVCGCVVKRHTYMQLCTSRCKYMKCNVVIFLAMHA